MNEIQSSRFKDASWFPKQEEYVIIGGAGGIGSWLSMMLARAGFQPIVYDFDTIEEHNMGGQLYDQHSIGLKKVQALKNIIKNFCNTDIVHMDEKYDSKTMSHHYVFSAFDNMQARKDMFEAWCEHVNQWLIDVKKVKLDSEKTFDENYISSVPIFIDGRLAAEQMQIFCVTPDKIDEYRKHLFDDSEVEDAPCTLKQTSHSAAMIASHMVGFFTNHYANNITKEKDRNIPFCWEYFIPINYINEE